MRNLSTSPHIYYGPASPGLTPGCFYANFNLFWPGESMQVCRQQVKDGILPVQSEEFLAVIEHAMIALDRIRSWIDGLLPWSELDARPALRRPISVIY